MQVEGGDDYTLWGSAQGWTFGDPGTANGEDFDGDGFNNQFEYLFGLDPTVVNGGPIVASLEKTGLTFSYTRRDPALTGVNLLVETSTDLENFLVDTGATELATATVGDVQTVEVTLSVTAADKLFARVIEEVVVLP